jgi:hypothetical protein
MSNRVNLAQLEQMPIGEVSKLPVEQLAMLLEDVTELKRKAKLYDDWLNSAFAIRYNDAAAEARRQAGKDTGKIKVIEDEYVVACDLPKKVEWDQAKLREAVQTIESWGEDPREYVQVDIKVAETKYNAWPSSIRTLFEPARTVGHGRPTYKFERREVA